MSFPTGDAPGYGMMNQVRDFAARDPSTAAHRIVGKKLFEEIAARPPAAR